MLKDAWESAKQNMRGATDNLCKSDIGSSHVRNLSIDMHYDDEQWRYILLPFYLAGYSFGGQYYNIMLNGQTGKLAGIKPVDWKKVRTITWLLALIPVLLAIIAVILSSMTGEPSFTMIGGIIGFAGVVSAIVLYLQAKKAEKIT